MFERGWSVGFLFGVLTGVNASYARAIIVLFLSVTTTACGFQPREDRANIKSEKGTESAGIEKAQNKSKRVGTIYIRALSQGGEQKVQFAQIGFSSLESIHPLENKKDYFVRIELRADDRNAGRNAAIVEYDEIADLIKGVQYISKIDKSVTKLDQFEATYETKAGLRVTTFNRRTSPDKVLVAVTIGTGPTGYMDLDDLKQFSQFIIAARERLDYAKENDRSAK